MGNTPIIRFADPIYEKLIENFIIFTGALKQLFTKTSQL